MPVIKPKGKTLYPARKLPLVKLAFGRELP